ncbi:hypothetical protein [Brevundimonas denitrificans]|uniref:hypothetical protein n=1 Tax=Brevundimonas denitrificans TaxID=1443434 RepID=UPI00352D1AF9
MPRRVSSRAQRWAALMYSTVWRPSRLTAPSVTPAAPLVVGSTPRMSDGREI